MSGLWNPFTQAGNVDTSSTERAENGDCNRRGTDTARKNAAMWSAASEIRGGGNKQFFNGSHGHTNNFHQQQRKQGWNGISGHKQQFHQRHPDNRQQPFGEVKGSFMRQSVARNLHAEIYCEICDLEFRSPRLYDDHVEKHLKCPKCQFIGVVDAVESHYENMHVANSRKRSAECLTPEELAAWKRERSRKFPRIYKDAEPVHPEHTKSSADTGLSSLASYGDDSDSGPEESACVIEKSASTEVPQSSNPERSTTYNTDERSMGNPAGPFRLKEESHDRPTGSGPFSRRKDSAFVALAKRPPRTLYEKLVAHDLEKSNDHLLQCFAFLQRSSSSL